MVFSVQPLLMVVVPDTLVVPPSDKVEELAMVKLPVTEAEPDKVDVELFCVPVLAPMFKLKTDIVLVPKKSILLVP